MHLKISSAKRRPFCPGGDELISLGVIRLIYFSRWKVAQVWKALLYIDFRTALSINVGKKINILAYDDFAALAVMEAPSHQQPLYWLNDLVVNKSDIFMLIRDPYIESTALVSSNMCNTYHRTSNIRRTLVVSKMVDHSDAPVGAAPTTSSLSF